MRRYSIVAIFAIALAVAGCSLVTPTHSVDDQSALQQLNSLRASLLKHYNAGDAAAVAALYSEDARLLPPEFEMIVGRAAIEAFWKVATDAGLQLALPDPDIEIEGNIAYVVGPYTFTLPGETTPFEYGKYVEIWRKMDGGSWKMVVDTFNTDHPTNP